VESEKPQMGRARRVISRGLGGAIAVSSILVLSATTMGQVTASSPLFLNLNPSDPASYSPESPTVWKDLSPIQRNGTIVGTLNYDATNGALVFPGGSNSTNSQGYVDMGSGFNDFGAGITVEFEAHFGAVNQAWERIFDFGNGPSSDNIWIGVFGESFSPNTLAIELFQGSTGRGRCISPSGTLSANVFDKYVITMDGTSCRMYKNGVEILTRVGTCTGSSNCSVAATASAYPHLPLNVTRQNNYVGRSNWGSDAAFNGAIKFVRVFTAALSSQEVANNAVTYSLSYATTSADAGTAPGGTTGNGLISVAENPGGLLRTGHSFVGWAASVGSTTAITGLLNLTADTTLHPVWIPDTLTITYAPGQDATGPDPTDPVTVSYGSTIITPASPYERPGFTFAGWTDGTSTYAAGATYPSVGSVTTNLTLVATWVPVSESTTESTPEVPVSDTSVPGSGAVPVVIAPPISSAVPQAPRRPVLDSNGDLPRVTPGQGEVTEDGVSVPVQIRAEAGADIVMRGEDFELRVRSGCANACAVSTSPDGAEVLTFEQGGFATVSGFGFQPGTLVSVWIFSEPRLLGEFLVNADGTFEGVVQLGDLAPGEHTVQVNGTGANALIRTANFGAVVLAAQGLLPSAGSNDHAMAWIIAFLAAGALLMLFGSGRGSQGALRAFSMPDENR
jgi:uncharacterized repeat protein (TIGR02543 family)